MKTLLILDYGSQVTQLIARNLREHGILSILEPCTLSAERFSEIVTEAGVAGIILGGSPASVLSEEAPVLKDYVLKSGLPILGICYGQQLLVKELGGRVVSGEHREYGVTALKLQEPTALLPGLKAGECVEMLMSHGDAVSEIPEGFRVIASSEGAPFAFIEDPCRHIYGIQFHPEVAQSVKGVELLLSFAIDICKISQKDKAVSLLPFFQKEIQEQVGDNKLIAAVSGGVDSTVAAVMAAKALTPEQVICIFVDTGLLRKNERALVEQMYARLNLKLTVVDASQLFLTRLKDQTDPEIKRKIIGNTFIEVFEAEAKKHSDASFLLQGTLYPDLIESLAIAGTGQMTIKSHHNVGGLPETMNLELVEPLRRLFKDEVRKLGEELGIDHDFLYRHPFPGPGLAVRCLGELSMARIQTLQEIDHIFIEALKRKGFYETCWQALAVLLPVKSVGVKGDERSYEEACVLRAITSRDGMTADVVLLPPEFLVAVAQEITNKVPGVNRVTYDYTGKPPATIEWE